MAEKVKVERKFGMNFIISPAIPEDTVFCYGREINEGESFEDYIKSKSCIVIKTEMTGKQFMERYPQPKKKE